MFNDLKDKLAERLELMSANVAPIPIHRTPPAYSFIFGVQLNFSLADSSA
jgi:hypothetical protein